MQVLSKQSPYAALLPLIRSRADPPRPLSLRPDQSFLFYSTRLLLYNHIFPLLFYGSLSLDSEPMPQP